ncbi:MAG: cobalamin B12-binding domain-containing protein [Armatimonadetes bacterium]|nr:cobalamin B12-binding domain-containing protein [Armatimonadota bacterium]
MLGLLEARDGRSAQSSFLSVGLGYLVAYGEKFFGPGSIWVARTVQDLVSRHPRAAGISACSPFIGTARDMALKIKEALGIPIILGGPHISALPGELPSWADVGVIGEGEATMVELLHALAPGGCSLPRIQGIVYRENGVIQVNPSRAPLDPLDQIPPPRRDQLLHGSPLWEEANLLTSRGAPLRTAWTPSWVGESFRRHTPDYVAREIRELIREFHPRFIGFQDELFAADRVRLRALVEILEREEICRDVTFGCVARPDLINREVCGLFLKMNLRTVLLLFFSGSDRVLKRTGKGLSLRQNQRALDLCYESGIIADGMFILFSPEEGAEDIRETLDFRNQNREKLRIAEFVPAIPYPGTAFWDKALGSGLVSAKDTDWKLLDSSADEYVCVNSTIPLEELSALSEELERL